MPRTRGAANRSLYHANILLDSWDRARGSTPVPDEQLTAAFLPAVRQHLRDAYGWFLLSTAGVEEQAGTRRPASTADLPPPEPGRSAAPELREFAQLESFGWIAELLSGNADDPGSDHRTRVDLLGSDHASPGFAVARRWADDLAAIMQRMDDFRAEC